MLSSFVRSHVAVGHGFAPRLAAPLAASLTKSYASNAKVSGADGRIPCTDEGGREEPGRPQNYRPPVVVAVDISKVGFLAEMSKLCRVLTMHSVTRCRALDVPRFSCRQELRH